MKKNILITFIITIGLGFFIGVYGMAMFSASTGLGRNERIGLGLLIVAIFAGFVYAIIHNMKERVIEIKEEEKDDLSKY